MNTLPPNEPLDDQEREFARILRALPGGEPPAALDAAILRAATNAAASSKQPVRRALASVGALWGIGSAAAAVLAVGVAWQMNYGARDLPAEASAPRVQAVSDADDSSVEVELGTQPADAPFVPPPPPPPPPPPAKEKPLAGGDQLFRAPAQPAREPVAGAAAPAAAEPEAFARDHLDEHVRSEEAAQLSAQEDARAAQDLEMKGRAADNERQRAAKMAANTAAPQAAAEAAAPAPAAPPPAATASRADDAGAGLGVLGGVAQAPKSEADTRKPGTWLADIRKLRDQGRLEEARASLVEFRKKYPKWVIPTDLAPLQPE